MRIGLGGKHNSIERQIIKINTRLAAACSELEILEAQSIEFDAEAEDAHMRLLMSETVQAREDSQHAKGHADKFTRRRESVRAEIERLQQLRNDLLSKLVV